MNNKEDLIFIFIFSIIAISLFLLIVIPRKTEAADRDTFIPESQVKLCESLGAEYGICPEVLEALIEVESAGKMNAQNGSCYGICQINGAVWGSDYNTEEKQIRKACEMLLSYELPIDEALSRYNGQSNYHYDGYVKKVLNRSHELEELHYGLSTN